MMTGDPFDVLVRAARTFISIFQRLFGRQARWKRHLQELRQPRAKLGLHPACHKGRIQEAKLSGGTRSMTARFASSTPSTSVRNTSSSACRANATPDAVSSPLTFSKADSPTASVGMTGTFPLLIMGSRRLSIRLDVRSDQSPGPLLLSALTAPNTPTAGTPARCSAHTSAVCTSPSNAAATAPSDLVRYTEAVDELGFDVHALQHARDLYASPMHDRPAVSGL